MTITKKILSGAASMGVFVALLLVASPTAHAQTVTTTSSVGAVSSTGMTIPQIEAALAAIRAQISSQACSAATSSVSSVSSSTGCGLTITQVEAEMKALRAEIGTPSTNSSVMGTAGGASMTSTTGMGSSITSTPSMSTTGSLSANLGVGASGAQVTTLQEWLISHGFSIPAGVTGHFGTETQAAVESYQRSVGITPVSGFVGSITREHINATASTNTSSAMSTGTPSMTSTNTTTNTDTPFSTTSSLDAQMAAIAGQQQGLENDMSAAGAVSSQSDTGN